MGAPSLGGSTPFEGFGGIVARLTLPLAEATQ